MKHQLGSGPRVADIAKAFLELGAATAGEAGGRPMHPRIRAVWKGAMLAAPAFPVRCARGDNLAVHVAVARAPAGCALVVDASALPERGYWGEVLTTQALARGVAGLVIDGGVRDVASLEALRFPVFSALVALTGASKTRGGSIGEPASVGDVHVAAGDWVVGDADGVVAIPGERLRDVLDAARARAAREQEIFTRLRAGDTTTLEILGLDADAVTDASRVYGGRD
jgi:4-hydroxy-4-methyl-2-oxoglutarate aldolase